MQAWLNIGIALIFNISYVYFLKKAEGFTVLWPTLIALVLIGLAQLFISRAMVAGMAPGLAMAVLGPLIMLGSAAIGYFLFGEIINPQKAAGISLAILGIVIASFA